MKDILFDTPEKKADAVLLFQGLKEHQGWQLLVQIVKENIKVLQKRLQDGDENETIEEVKELRHKITIHQFIIDTPDNMIKDFTEGSDDKEFTVDPYAKTLEESRKPIT